MFLQIFNRVLRSFQLPVGPKEFHAESVRKRVFFDSQKAASLIVSMMVNILFLVQLESCSVLYYR